MSDAVNMRTSIGIFTASVNGVFTGCALKPARSYYRMDLKGILARIEERLEVTDQSAHAASLRSGHKDAIRNLERKVKSGKSGSLNLATMRDLAQALDTTPQWLQFGDGDAPPAIAYVPLLDYVAAGKLKRSSSQIPVEDVPLLAFADLGPGEWFALRVEGTSMDRISPEGSIIVVNRKDKVLISGKYYVFSVRGETTYKRWQGGEPPYLEPYSTESVHRPIFPRDKAGLEVVGRVKRTVLDL